MNAKVAEDETAAASEAQSAAKTATEEAAVKETEAADKLKEAETAIEAAKKLEVIFCFRFHLPTPVLLFGRAGVGVSLAHINIYINSMPVVIGGCW